MSDIQKKSPLRRAVLIALPFVCIYFVIRALPVTPCDFLHEESYNLEGELDYCGPGDSDFVDLTVRKWPMKMDFKPIDTPEVGKSCRFEINIKQFDGSPLGPDDVALSHTEKIHLMAIDESLEDYQHLHPEADELFDGTWRFSMTPKKSGKYKIFIDFIPLRSPRRVLLASSFEVLGEAKSESKITPNLKAQIGDRFFSLVPRGVVKSGSEVSLELEGLDDTGNPIQLTPVMGAFAHLVAFDPTLKGFAHLHPNEESLPKSNKDIHLGKLVFNFSPPQNGIYRLWAQIRIKDQEYQTFIPFDLLVES